MLLFDSSKHTLKRIESLKELIKLVQGRFPLHEGTVDDKRLETNGTRCDYQMSAIQFANHDLLICVVFNTWPLSEATPDQDMGVEYWYATHPSGGV